MLAPVHIFLDPDRVCALFMIAGQTEAWAPGGIRGGGRCLISGLQPRLNLFEHLGGTTIKLPVPLKTARRS